MQLKEYRDSLPALANEVPNTQNGRIVAQAALALAAKIDILLAELESPTQLTETEQMLLVVNQHIQYIDGKVVLDGKAFAGDIPPSVKWDFYYKVTQSSQPIVTTQETPADIPADADVQKKSLSQTVAANDIDSELEKYDSQVVGALLKADAFIKSSLSAVSVEKAKSVVTNASLMQIARAADLLKPEEINLKDPNGLGNISRRQLADRVYNYYQSQKQKQNEEAGSNEAGTENTAI
jgi:hypothetical protein